MNRENLSYFIDFVRNPQSTPPTLPFTGAYMLHAIAADLSELQYYQLTTGELWSYFVNAERFNALPPTTRRNITYKVLDFALGTGAILWLPAARVECGDDTYISLIEYKPGTETYERQVARRDANFRTPGHEFPNARRAV